MQSHTYIENIFTRIHLHNATTLFGSLLNNSSEIIYLAAQYVNVISLAPPTCPQGEQGEAGPPGHPGPSGTLVSVFTLHMYQV